MNPILDLIRQQSPEKIALRRIDGRARTEDVSYAELDAYSDGCAALLRARGCQKGSRVLIRTTDSKAVFAWFFGALKCAAVPCVLYPSLGSGGLLTRLRSARADFYIGNDAPDLPGLSCFAPDFFCDAPFDGCEPVADDDPAFMVFTSGSTGQPKGIVHSYRLVPKIVRSMTDVLGVKDDDVYWCTAHPAWITGTVYGLLGPLLCGITTIQYEGAFHPSRWLPILRDEKVSFWYTAPTALRALAREDEAFWQTWHLSSLRAICSIGEPLSVTLKIWGVRTFGVPIRDTWFQTETGIIRIASDGETPINAMGKAADGAGVSVKNEAGIEQKRGTVGQLWADGRATGDLASMDEADNVYYVGRADSVINTSGHLVGCLEIENALRTCAEVEDAAVIPEADELTWQRPAAFIVLREGVIPNRVLEAGLRSAVSAAIAVYAVPKTLRFLSSLPKTANGKTDYAALRTFSALPLQFD